MRWGAGTNPLELELVPEPLLVLLAELALELVPAPLEVPRPDAPVDAEPPELELELLPPGAPEQLATRSAAPSPKALRISALTASPPPHSNHEAWQPRPHSYRRALPVGVDL